ncbi:efflux RND transporter permease subunit [Oxalobacter vibrioformis]|uniref:Efflux RND transporter permease subunit n=1 Tax=Oxalobacter vibrioformis TaxID=933080 RepID=A0A9E9LXY1_9BURK|nr:efflux RND transporter permease subunit [Oxalobacter vibrioformis]WAW09610.1 efflux RND transporter permease subunit [Oxalobacter vibrioformis]
MWIVRYALRRPYSVAAMALIILIAGIISYLRLPVDVLPNVDIPSVKIVWNYKGLNANEMAAKITSWSEIAVINNVDNVQEVTSQTLSGISVIRVAFQPDVDIPKSLAQITAITQTIMKRMPRGITPPNILQYNQSRTPIMQLVLSSNTLPDSRLADFARMQLRSMVQSIPGVLLTLPYGAVNRQIMVDLKPDAAHVHGITAAEVTEAVDNQNTTLPSGSLRENEKDLQITLNTSPDSVEAFGMMPVRAKDGRTVLLRDVADVRDGVPMKTNVARVNGENAVIVSLIRIGNASTISIIKQLQERLPEIRQAAPEGMTITPIFDQSVFVSGAMTHIESEIFIVASLVALVVMFFLGSWRATLIVLTSIPLSLLAALVMLRITGHTLNLISLGGLALAIGILVDNALVEIENITRNIGLGLEPREAALESARQVAFPELISTLSTCLVFSPIFLLSGVAGFIFRPMAIVVIASLAMSYLLSRTVVPVLAMLLMKPASSEKTAHGRLARIHHHIEHGLDGIQALVGRLLGVIQRAWFIAVIGMLIVIAGGAFTLMTLGRDFFPKTDAGLMRFYIRVAPGTRIENTSDIYASIQGDIRNIIPENEIDTIVENIGVPEAANLGWVDSYAVGSYDGELQIQLAKNHHPSAGYEKAIRAMLQEKYPDVVMFSQPADTTNLTLAGATPTALDIRIAGRDTAGNRILAAELVDKLKDVKGAVDIGIQQVFNQPEYYVAIDRARAIQLGVNMSEAQSVLLAALGSAGSVNENFWVDPVSGFSYTVQVQAPVQRMDTIDILTNLRVPAQRAETGTVPLASIASVTPRLVSASVGRVTLMPMINVLVNTEDTDIGTVYKAVEKGIAELKPRLKPGNSMRILGQADSMMHAYGDLFFGFALALFFIYIIMLFNFASWVLPVIALAGAPIALSGAAFALALTGTTLSVPALMGFIMVMGVSTANSVLVTTFARDQWLAGMDAIEAARSAATTRLRPVLMTAITMIVGVVPMALAAGQGGEQNAPLARAVIGGLLLGTCASLILVPTLFGIVMRHVRRPAPDNRLETPQHE